MYIMTWISQDIEQRLQVGKFIKITLDRVILLMIG